MRKYGKKIQQEKRTTNYKKREQTTTMKEPNKLVQISQQFKQGVQGTQFN